MSSPMNAASHAGPRRAESPVSGPSSIIAVGSSNEEDLYAAAAPQSPQTPSSSMISAQTRPDGSDPERSAPGITDFDHDMSAYPASMTSSIRAHVWEGGLRYHAFRDGKYAFPNDEVEQNRDDMKHAMTLLVCRGRHFYAPLDPVLRLGGEVLDLGTGTGVWAIELGEKYPNAIVNGIDLSPIQPTYVPENVFFNVDDFEDDWVFKENHFDLVHMRHTLHSVRDRSALLRKIYSHLKPGGWVEFKELHNHPHCDDDTVTPDTPYALRDFATYMDAGMRALGSDLNSVVLLPDEMRAAGFQAVTMVTHKCPIGCWPREKRLRYCGLFLRTAIMDGLRGLVRRPLGTGLGWTPVQIEMYLVEVRKAVMNGDFHTYLPFHIAYAQKPPSG